MLFRSPGVRNFRSLVRNFRPKENLAKSFSRFLSGGGPELCTGGLLRNFGVSPGISGPRPEVPALKPGISGPTFFQQLVFGEAIKCLLLPQNPGLTLLTCFPLSSIVANLVSLIPLNPSNDSCPNLGFQERRSRSTIPPIKFSSK